MFFKSKNRDLYLQNSLHSIPYYMYNVQEPSMPSLAPFGQAVSEKIFLTLANQKKELILAAMFVGRMEPNEAL
jgi:hypothetical protein